MKKELYIPLGALVAVFGIFSWFFDKQDAKIEKVEAKTEKVAEEVDREENINLQQSIIMERNTKLIEKLEEKLK